MPLAAEYLGEIARQIGFIAAFLGGVSGGLMAALLALPATSRASGWAIGSAAGSAVCFIVTVVATTLLTMAAHPQAPANVGAWLASGAMRALAFGPFLLGLYLLLATIALAGWLRSRRLGRATTAMAAAGAVLVTLSLAG